MMDRAVVFLGGAPATGKTTLAAGVSAGDTCLHLKASQIIREAKGLDAERPFVSDAEDARSNQELLLAGFRRFASLDRRAILIDGHFVVPPSAGLYDIDIDVFWQMGVTAIALVEATVQVCAGRLRRRASPALWWDGEDGSLAELHERERARASVVAHSLGIPFIEPTPDALSHCLHGGVRCGG
jgi:adenylate kinase